MLFWLPGWARSGAGRRDVLSLLLVWTEVQVLLGKRREEKGPLEKCRSCTRGCFHLLYFV